MFKLILPEESKLIPMEVITIESDAYRSLQKKLDAIYLELKKINSPKEQLQNEWLSTTEVEQFLRVCQKTRINYQNAGLLTPQRIKRRAYYKLEEVKALLAKKETTTIRLT